MSITRTLLRIATVQSLIDATLVGDAVFDSIVDPLDARIDQHGKRPVIVVYTDDHIGAPAGKSDFLQGGQVDLVIEAVVAGVVSVGIEGGDGEQSQFQLSVPNTDAGTEVILDLIEAQVVSALTGGTGPWAELWRLFCVRVIEVSSRRSVSAESGARFAVRQLTITCDCLVDPDRGAPLPEESAWLRMLRMMNEVDGLRSIAEILVEEIQGQPRTDWRRAAARLGVNLSTITALGLGPIGADDPVPLVEGTVDGGAP